MTSGGGCSDPVATPAFQAWFEGSKVVDENGRPLVVYHGTPYGEFEQFDLSRAGRDAFRSVWFTECEGQALMYALGQKERPYSVLPVLEELRQQQPDLVGEIDAFEATIRVTTHPDGTVWESFDQRWLCERSRLFNYEEALRKAYREARGPRIRRAYLRSFNPYIGADEAIARRLWKSHCMYDSYLSIMAPYAEWAIPSDEQIWLLDPTAPRISSRSGLTFGMANSAAGLGRQWTYDLASALAASASGVLGSEEGAGGL